MHFWAASAVLKKVAVLFCAAAVLSTRLGRASALPSTAQWVAVSEQQVSDNRGSGVHRRRPLSVRAVASESRSPSQRNTQRDTQLSWRRTEFTRGTPGRHLTEASPPGPCNNLLDAIAQQSAAFNASLHPAAGVVSAATTAALARPAAAYTVLIPPPAHLDALLAAFRDGTVDVRTARTTLLLHILPLRLRAVDLRALGTGSRVPTLSRAGNITVTILDADTIAFDRVDGGYSRVIEQDISTCGTVSVQHRVDALLTAAAFPLPAGLIPASAGGGDSGPRARLVIGIILAAAAVVCAVIAALVMKRRRGQARPQRAAHTPRATGPAPRTKRSTDRPKLLPLGMRLPSRSDTGGGRDTSGTLSWNPVATLSEFSCYDDDDGDSVSAAVLRMPGAFLTPGGSSLAGAAAVSLSAATGDPSSSSQSAQRTPGRQFSTSGTTHGSSTQRAAAAEAAPPLPGARPEERRQWLMNQLDCIGSTPLLQRFVLLGPAERKSSDDTVVQFARSTDDDEQFALKFFISREKFDAERTVFAHWILGAMLPRLEGLYDNRDGALQDPRGHTLPPCVIMERGESLHEWFKRRKPDLSTALPVVARIAKRVAGMHRGGYVHRDLKPSNIMWLPRDSQWSLIDFGAAAEVGRPAPLNCTLPYAPPEVVAAWNGGRTSVIATHALDAWALGVVIFEMLTGRPAFDMETGNVDRVREALMGQGALPWERLGSEDRRRLGPLKGALMLLLQRDPQMRASLDLFYHKCNAILK